MNRIISIRALRATPRLVSDLLRTQHTSSIQTSNFLYRTIVHQSFPSYATFFSSKKIIDSPVEREHLP